MTGAFDWVVYGLAWIVFGVLHSILASAAIKSKLAPYLGAGYRLVYNAFAMVSLIAILAIGHIVFNASPFDLSNAQRIALSILAISGWIIMFLSLREYDLGLFLGTKQLRAARNGGETEIQEPLTTSGMHRYVRHPLYSGAFLALWGAAWSPLGLATAIFASAYLIIGARYEEARLTSQYGEAYANYRARVPAFVPWKIPKAQN